MIPFAHIAGVPVEEMMPALYAGAGLWAGLRVVVSRWRPTR